MRGPPRPEPPRPPGHTLNSTRGKPGQRSNWARRRAGAERRNGRPTPPYAPIAHWRRDVRGSGYPLPLTPLPRPTHWGSAYSTKQYMVLYPGFLWVGGWASGGWGAGEYAYCATRRLLFCARRPAASAGTCVRAS